MSDCTHVWKIEGRNGTKWLHSECRKCGATKSQPADLPEYAPFSATVQGRRKSSPAARKRAR